MISDNSNENTLNKIINAIKFAKEYWGYEIEDIDFEVNNTNLKRKVFELKRNKRWRIGKAIAQELEHNEIPNAYVEIIKKVSKL
jgi:hypothetical protein